MKIQKSSRKSFQLKSKNGEFIVNEIYLIKSCDRHVGEMIRGDFHETIDSAKAEIDRIFERYTSDNPRFIERLEPNQNCAGFQVITRWGQWRSYGVWRVDRFGRSTCDLQSELIEGNNAKAGVL